MSFFTQMLGGSIARMYLNGDPTGVPTTTLGISQTTQAGGFNLHLGLFTAKPGDVGTEAFTSECTSLNYAGYLRQKMDRYKSYPGGSEPAAAWTIATSGNTITATNALTVNFPPCTGAAGAIITHWALMTDATAGYTLMYGGIKASGASWKVGMYADTATNYIDSPSHGLSSNDPVLVSTLYNDFASSIPGGATAMADGTIYYAGDISADRFRLYASSGPTTLKTFSNVGPFMFIKTAPVTVALNGIPSFVAGSLVACRIC